MTIIAGLGNPGSEYAATRHNLGYQVVDAIAASQNLSWKKNKQLQCELIQAEYAGQSIRLAKSMTYMNHSGRALGKLANYYKLSPEQFVVVHDDVGLPLGRSKLSVHGGAGGHNGVADIIQHLGKGFIRMRIGIGAKPLAFSDLKDWVIGRFNLQEQDIINHKMNDFLAGIQLLLSRGLVAAMNTLNQKEKKAKHSNEPDNNETKL